jgi:hypothetical protein
MLRSIVVVLVSAAMLAGGCADSRPKPQAADPELSAYVELVLPTRIEVQRFLTKPVSFAGDSTADGLEVILAAYDSADDLTKVVGSLQIELQTRKKSETIGTRVAFWPLDINTRESVRLYRDRLSRFYAFPLQLEQPLAVGDYKLTVWLHLPSGKRLYDEYEFTYEGKGAPPVGPH